VIRCPQEARKMNQEQIDRINQLLRQENINQKDFIVSVLSNSNVNNISEGYEKQKANFSKMMSGERDFPDKYILGIERTLHTSWNYIVDGTNFDKSFVSRGIRYTAYKGTYQDFDLLGKELSQGDHIICNYDEYNNSILDYILEYKAIEGLRYLFDNKLVELHFDCNQLTGKIFSSRGPQASCKEALLLICEKEDVSLFTTMFDSYKLFQDFIDGETIFDNPEVQEAILKKPKILSSLLEEKAFSLKELNPEVVESRVSQQEFHLCSPILCKLLVFALHDSVKYQKQLTSIIEFGKRFNDARISQIEKMSEDEQNDIALSDDGLLSCGRLKIGNLFTYRLTEQLDLSDEIIQSLGEINDQINRVKFREKPLLGGLSRGNSRIINGQLVKRSTKNKDEYTFLKLMADNNIQETPRLLKQENGLDYLTYFPGESAYHVYAMPMTRILQVIKLLRKINDISKKALGNGKVYVHGDLSAMNAVFQKDSLVGLIDFDSVHIGEEYEDFIYVAWTWLNIGDYTRNNAKILEDMITMLKAYGADESFKKDFASKITSVMDARLASTPKDSASYARIFQWVGWSKIWVELMKDEITRKIG
jgi:thiamine kinase-like enzyme